MGQVDNIIHDRLAAGCDVCLPGVGSLVVSRTPARRLSSRRISPPVREILFSSGMRGRQLPDIVAAAADIPAGRAGEIYRRWLQGAADADGNIRIEGVGTIAGGSFMADDAFESLLNPAGRQSVALPSRRRPRIVASVIASLAVVCLLGAVAIRCFRTECLQQQPSRPVGDVVADDSAAQPAGTAVMPQVAVPAETPAENIAETTAETTAGPSAETSAETEVLAMTAGWNYGVWGVYRNLDNARLYRERLVARWGERVDLKIFAYGRDRYMLSVCDAASRTECNHAVMRLRGLSGSFDEVWIYTFNAK